MGLPSPYEENCQRLGGQHSNDTDWKVLDRGKQNNVSSRLLNVDSETFHESLWMPCIVVSISFQEPKLNRTKRLSFLGAAR